MTGAVAYEVSEAEFGTVVDFLASDAAAGLEHAELEVQLAERGRRLLCCLFQDHLAQRARHEPRLAPVVDADGADRPRNESGHHRRLTTIFGDVDVERRAYRRPGAPNLHPAERRRIPSGPDRAAVRERVRVRATVAGGHGAAPAPAFPRVGRRIGGLGESRCKVLLSGPVRVRPGRRTSRAVGAGGGGGTAHGATVDEG